MLCFRIKWDLEFECENDEKFLGGVATQISFCTFLEITVGVTVKVAICNRNDIIERRT